MNNDQKEPKRRILDTAISLFARKGFAAVGVREIARAADVNISMISYYFGGKVGVLKTIVNEFHDQYHRMIAEVNDTGVSPEEWVRELISRMVGFIRTNKELSMIAFNTICLDIPEIADLKAERIPELLGEADEFIAAFGLDSNDAAQMSIIGPALFTIVSAHFRLERIQEHIFNTKFDDAFYERYVETLADLFLHGVKGWQARAESERSQ